MKTKERYTSVRFVREFDRLRRAQGEQQSIMPRVRQVRDLRGASVVELGAGTGVMTQQLASEAGFVMAFDRSHQMISYAQKNLRCLGVKNCSFAQAVHSRIPLPSRCADVVIAFWALDSVVFDSCAGSWREEIDLIVLEMRRLVKTGGTIILLAAPLRGERDYLGHLECTHGFRRELFRSVWRFASKKDAREAISFFLRKEIWKGYEPHWPKEFAMPAGIWWRTE